MFKLLIIATHVLLTVAAFPDVQLFVPETNYAISSSGTLLEGAVPPASETNDVLQDDDTDEADAVAAVDAKVSESAAGAEPSDAAAKATTRATVAVAAGSELGGSSTIQHHILPAEVIPLPLTISTRAGLRTVIAPETITIHQPTVAKVGELVQKIPTAVSHQSQTVVHKHARVVTPIVAPAVRTISSQVVRAYHTPLIYAAHAPVLKIINN